MIAPTIAVSHVAWQVGPLSAFLQMIRSRTSSRVLSNPTLITRSAQEAKFHSGGTFYLETSRTENGITHVEFKEIEYGIHLGVLPVIDRLSTLNSQLSPRRPSADFSQTRISTSFQISIDTMKPNVARAALDHGAEIVNDVTGLRDPAMREVVRASGAGAIAMHMQGAPLDMQRAPHYDDVCGEIREFFRQTLEACLASGMDVTCLAFDPGIGFGKTVPHNLAILRNLDSMRVGGRPLVLGVSRKSFIGKVLGSDAMEDRAWPTLALTSYGRARGASVFRVHDVRPNAEALRMTEAILSPEASA